jgi:hypothetical protein
MVQVKGRMIKEEKIIKTGSSILSVFRDLIGLVFRTMKT